MTGSVEVVVVGGGIAGSALAATLAGSGLEVLLLERQTVYRDKVRGEVFMPWGAAEVRRLGLDPTLLAAGGGYATRLVRYEEWLAPDEAEAQAIALDQVLAGVPGSLNVGHPEACEALVGAAEAAGARVVRGVGDVTVTPADGPGVVYRDGEVAHEVRCRLVVGADGRHSTVRRRLGIELHETEPRTIGGGMLVDGVPEWPADLDATGTEGDLYFLAFPRPGGRVRIYLLWSIDDRGRFSGPHRHREFLDACRFRSLPYGEAVAAGNPAGPCSSYPMTDSWCDRVAADGVVLIGDAAGWSDPIIGQGVSLAMRDARQVSEVVLGGDDWSASAFRTYAGERAERLRRLRVAARIQTALQTTFGAEGTALRRRWHTQAREDFLLLAPLLGLLVGPEQVPAEAFTDANVERALA